MRAAVYRKYGPPEVVRIEEVQKPVPKDNEVLIEVRAASVNPLDWKVMSGGLRVVRTHRLFLYLSHVYRRLQLLKLDPKLKQFFLDGEMTAAHGLILAPLQPRDQKELVNQLKQAAKNGAVEFPSVARLQSWVEENVFLSLDGAPFSKDDAALVPEAGPCTSCPSVPASIPHFFQR
ncbi:MAG TPA: hypothetical protein VMI06_03570 [Terriglobia bacterium]|nr:hypothetical protein [Terriglobia bacterium]